jgi:hypothetical protein
VVVVGQKHIVVIMMVKAVVTIEVLVVIAGCGLLCVSEWGGEEVIE